MIILEVTVVASGGEVQGRIGAPQALRSTNADSSGPSSNQMQVSSAPQTNSTTGVNVNSDGLLRVFISCRVFID